VAVVDAGVAPGLSNLILGYLESTLAAVDRFECHVGGIPADPAPPWEYKASFSPVDVLAEYTRPARLRQGGVAITVPALSELEEIDFPGIGRLEAFATDGLRTLLRTSAVPDLVEKTLRWPGHAQRILLLRDSGFLDAEPVDIGGQVVRPTDLSGALLARAWRYDPGEADVMVMRAVATGRDAQGPVRHTYSLLDRYDATRGQSAMARTTGFTATALARFILEGGYREPGLSAPESLGPLALHHVVTALRARGVHLQHGEERR
jgi:lysine 6-dehydrogenase